MLVLYQLSHFLQLKKYKSVFQIKLIQSTLPRH